MRKNVTWTQAASVKVLRKRAGGQCEIGLPGICTFRPTDWSHRKGRGQCGTWAPSNGLHSCRPCHDWIGSHRSAAYANGWMVRGGYNHEAIPVLLRSRTLVKLDDQGAYLPV